jgi:RNA polymerase sigma-70 factor (ECF subfamily)
MSMRDHERLAARLARGDDDAFAELYDACADRLHHYVAVRLGCREAAADVLQSAFLRAVKSRRRFRGVENPVAYMFQIARNEAARASRRAKQSMLPTDDAFDLQASVEDSETTHDDAEVAAAALDRLEIDAREIVELKVYGGLTFREIADVTQLSQGTVATRYRRALESLRGWLVKQLR